MQRLLIILPLTLLIIIASGCVDSETSGLEQAMEKNNSISENGSFTYSLGRGIISSKFTDTTPDDPPPGSRLNPEDFQRPVHTVYNVKVDRQSPALIEPEIVINYSFDYLTSHHEDVTIVGTPLYDGNTIFSARQNPTQAFPSGDGSGSGYFAIYETAAVNQFRVRMYASENNDILHERTYAVDYRFRSTGPGSEAETEPDPEQPVAKFTFFPETPDKNEVIIFDAGDSYSPQGQIVGYEWDFGDGEKERSDKPLIEKAFSMPGTYSVSLTLLDEEGRTAKTELYLPVVAMPAFSPVEQGFPEEQPAPQKPPAKAVPDLDDGTALKGGRISNIVFDPPPPQRLPLGTPINVSFNYTADRVELGDVLIITICPLAQGEMISEELFPCSTYIRDNLSGIVKGSFTIRNNPINIHQVRIRIHRHLSGEVIAEKVINVEYIISAR